MSGVATMDGVGVSAAAVAVCRAAGEMGVDEASRLAVLYTAAEAARAESWVDDAIATAEAAALAAGVDVAGTREGQGRCSDRGRGEHTGRASSGRGVRLYVLDPEVRQRALGSRR